VVKTAISDYNWEVLGILDGFEGLIQPGKIRQLTHADVRGILPRGGTILGTTNRADPFHYVVRTDEGEKIFDVSNDVVRYATVLGIDVLVVIGGDGSLRIAYELMQKGLKVIGVPKTIDNDLQQTLVTFGFDTALNTAMEALDKLHTTAESHHRVIILEVMGRDAGWIALQAGIAGGADVILIPEIPFNLSVIAEKIETRNQRGAKFSIIVIAEGAREQGNQAVYQQERDPGEMERLGGAGNLLAGQLRLHGIQNIRVTVLGHLQRGGSPSAFDRLLASRFGAMAVHYIAQGHIGCMVALKDDAIISVPLETAVGQQKFVPLNSDIILTAFGLDINLGENRNKILTMALDTQAEHFLENN
jgi:6-phosphofructokinase 1